MIKINALIFLLLLPFMALSQFQPTSMKQIREVMDTLVTHKPEERLYLHLDRSNYLTGDTLWFKAYLLSGPYLVPSEKSGIFYVELVNAGNNVIKRMKLPIKYGLGWGNLTLDVADMASGNYAIRAYTNWMLNFGENAVFTKDFYVANPSKKANSEVVIPSEKINPVKTLINNGTKLLINGLKEDSLELIVKVLDDKRIKVGAYYLIAESRGLICYVASVNFRQGDFITKIDKKTFPTGITRFTLLNDQFKPLNESIVPIDHNDQLKVTINTSQTEYKTKDSIRLSIQVNDKDNVPVQGSFSISVTDDRQVALHQTNSLNLGNYMLFSKDSESQYLSDSTVNLPIADNYWQKKFKHEGFKYKPEPEYVISGKVKSALNGLPYAKVSLFSQNPLTLLDTVSGPDGVFVFKGLPIGETGAYKIQASNKKEKNTFVSLEMDEWVPPVFKSIDLSGIVGMADSSFVQKVKETVALRVEHNKLTGELLNEVEINAKKAVNASHNLNGPGKADQTMNESDLKKLGKKSLYLLLFEQVKGLNTGSYQFPPSTKRKVGMKIYSQLVKIIIDGVDLDHLYEYSQSFAVINDSSEGMQERFTFLKSNLELFTAEDIKGIEVIYSSSYNTKYNQKFLSQAETVYNRNGNLTGVGGISGVDYAYIEITTRSGKGPFMKPTPGTYLYKPLAFSLPYKFQYSKYSPTVYWEPSLVTNEKGQASIIFPAGEIPSSYTITIEGSNMDGNFGNLLRPAFVKVAP